MSTLKEKFNNVEIMFEGQIGSLKYDELYEASNQCEQIADDYAIEFLVFEHEAFSGKIMNYEYAKAMLETFKKQKGY